MAAIEPLKARKRPIARLGVFVISHSLIVSVICCIAAILALLLLPVLAKNTYISENALMPGSANTMLSSEEVSEADRFMKDVNALSLESVDAGIKIAKLIAQYMADLGAEVCYHKFHHQQNQFNPLHFFSIPDPVVVQRNISCLSFGVNTVGVIRAPRGDGKEAIVLVTPYNSSGMDAAEASSLGIGYSIFSLLSQVTWLAKDIIWLAADSRFGVYAPVAAWLKDYHTPLFSGLGQVNAEVCHESNDLLKLNDAMVSNRNISNIFTRSGTMAAALVIKVVDRHDEADKDTLSIFAEASNGQMPNLDLINIVNYLAVHRQGLRVKVEKFFSLLDSKFLNLVGETVELLGKVAKSLNPNWRFGIPVAEYVEGTATLASSLFNQALGVPTGPHGAFRDYQVDAITLEISPKGSLKNKDQRIDFLMRGGRLVEAVVRSVNNLLEKFHQSFFLYLLTSPSKFVSVGIYMIAFALLIAPLPIVAASLYSDANRRDSSLRNEGSSQPHVFADEPTPTLKSWRWLHAAKSVFIIHFWGSLVTLLPHFISKMPNGTPTSSLIIWLSLCTLSLFLLYMISGSPFSHATASQPQEWAVLKSVTVSAAFIGLCLMSVINFATAEIGALLIVPMCLVAYPLKLDLQDWSFRALIRAACNLTLVLISFPPATFYLFKGGIEGFKSVNAGDFWNWLETLWAWNSATYLYIGMVHLPCWVSCVNILLHPC
ncbi:GPI transamidase component Gaa1 [Dillenia turbinata]|uniref:GPI transamidase component Gaa1 n=1 Tax=Dillenia turbinata TaxID=194707 RepID=A0AAN8VSP6_9MAGN